MQLQLYLSPLMIPIPGSLATPITSPWDIPLKPAARDLEIASAPLSDCHNCWDPKTCSALAPALVCRFPLMRNGNKHLNRVQAHSQRRREKAWAPVPSRCPRLYMQDLVIVPIG